MKYVRKPQEIDAEQWDGTRERAQAIVEWAGIDDIGDPRAVIAEAKPPAFGMIAYTDTGPMEVPAGGYVVRSERGGLYVVPARIFEMTYEEGR